MMFSGGSRILSYGLAERWNIKEAARLLNQTPGRELREVAIPDFALEAVEVTKKAPQRIIESILKSPRYHLRCVSVSSSSDIRKEIIPYCIFSFSVPVLIYLPYSSYETTLFGRFQLLHEIGHATTNSNWCLVQRYQYVHQFLLAGIIIIYICQSYIISTIWIILICFALQYIIVNWYIEREENADRFALAHLKLKGEDDSIIDILSEVWEINQQDRTSIFKFMERSFRLDNAKRFWSTSNSTGLQLAADGYCEKELKWSAIILLLLASVLAGILRPDPRLEFAWTFFGIGIAMCFIYLLVGFIMIRQYGHVMDIWVESRLKGEVFTDS